MKHPLILTLAILCYVSVARSQIVIQMQKQSSVYTVPCKVNGVPMKFIFDTGASQVSISLTEAEFLAKNGLLNEDDLIGKEYYQNANGAIYEGMKVLLRQIEFGTIMIKNVVASVSMNNEAPLLLGQSILSRIGNYQIDPIKHTVTVTPPASNTGFNTVSDIDGNKYKTVQVGTQTWMAENLRTTKFSNGESIPHAMKNDDWTKADEGCYTIYNNDTSKKLDYGLLYNWEAAIDGRGICPTGWHVPSNDEVLILLETIKTAGLKSGSLKGMNHWQQPNEGSINSYGFNATPGGKRWFKNGNFQFIDQGGYHWTSSASGPLRAIYFTFSFDSAEIKLGSFYRNDGFSCRCIKD